MKIFHKLLFIIIILAISNTLALGFIFNKLTKNILKTKAEKHLESVAVLKENQINDLFNEMKHEIESINREEYFKSTYKAMLKDHNQDEILSKSKYHHEIRQLLTKNVQLSNNFNELFILNQQGEVHISSNPDIENKTKNQEMYFLEGQKQTFISDIHLDSSNNAAIFISTPIKNDQMELLGVLVGKIRPDTINKIMAEITGLGETGETYLVNKSNLLITNLKFDNNKYFNKNISTNAIESCLQENSGQKWDIDYHNKNALQVYRWLPDREFCVIVEQDESEIFNIFNQIISFLIIIMIIVILGIIILGYLLVKTITNPLKKISFGVKKIKQGKLDHKIDIKTNDELNNLAQILNQTTTALKKATTNLEQKVQARTKELNKTIDLMVGRELKMIDLKKENEKLKKDINIKQTKNNKS